ncbi:MAG: sulfatase [Planctomycetes bacterium]|nr:sulfatase [Planctomycetota bacterium]
MPRHRSEPSRAPRSSRSIAAGITTAIILLAVAGLPSRAAAAAPARPNVLFIAIDDLRVEIGCYGASHVTTPHIDRLAASGMRFDRAYVQAAFCNPSRASFLTGLRPDRTGVLDNTTWFRSRLPDVVTLPQLFKESGYQTVRLGKIYHGEKSMEDPKAWDAALYPKGTERGGRGEGRNLTGGEVPWCRWMAAEGGDEDQPDGQIAREAVAFLSKRPQKPFFLAVGFHKPHDPFVAPAGYFEHYPLDELKLHRDPPDRAADVPFAIPPRGWKTAFDKFSDRERREFLRAYYACTTFVDAQVGKVLRALEDFGLAGSTIVVLLSDHGYHLGERGWWNKNTLFELTARSPLIVRAPAMRAKGQGCSRLVEFVDIYPTLADLCGLPPPAGLPGRSFGPLLDDPAQRWKDGAFTQLVRGRVAGRTVRTERWRCTEWDEGRQGVELYDHEADSGEYSNLAEDPKHADVLAKLRAQLRRAFQPEPAKVRQDAGE